MATSDSLVPAPAVIQVWLASHLPADYGVLSISWLVSAVDSALALHNQLTVHIGVSADLQDTLDALNHPSHRVRFYKSEKQLSQFQHLRRLHRSISNEPDDWIFFLDDDDLLLAGAFDHLHADLDGTVGCQYVLMPAADDDYEAKVQEQMLLKTPQEFWQFYRNTEGFKIVDDFSGTALRRKYLDQYFGSPSKYGRISLICMFEDCELMEFIEKLPGGQNLAGAGLCEKASVFHRVKPRSLWKEQFASCAYVAKNIPKTDRSE